MGDDIINELGNNVQDLYGILCHVIPNCGNLSKHINRFLEKHPFGCKTASSCVQVITGINGIKIENVGVIFACDDIVVFIECNNHKKKYDNYI
jgi:hypothetical protein